MLGTELADLENPGSMRGEAGHLSPYTESSVVLTRQDYPKNVREWVESGRDTVLAIITYLDRLIADQ